MDLVTENEMIAARQAVGGFAYSSRSSDLGRADDTIRRLWMEVKSLRAANVKNPANPPKD